MSASPPQRIKNGKGRLRMTDDEMTDDEVWEDILTETRLRHARHREKWEEIAREIKSKRLRIGP